MSTVIVKVQRTKLPTVVTKQDYDRVVFKSKRSELVEQHSNVPVRVAERVRDGEEGGGEVEHQENKSVHQQPKKESPPPPHTRTPTLDLTHILCIPHARPHAPQI
jgi:hypothetical protein